MSAPGPLSHWSEIILGLFPFLARFGVSPATKALEIRSANGKMELEGGGPAVLRVPDVARLKFDPGIPTTGPGPAIYTSLDGGTTWAVVELLTPGSTVGGTVPPMGGDNGTAITTGGSGKVTCG